METSPRTDTAQHIETRLGQHSGACRLPHLLALAHLLEHDNLPRRLVLLAEADHLLSAECPSEQRAMVRIWRLRGAVMVRDTDAIEPLLTRAQADVGAVPRPRIRAMLSNVRALIAHQAPDAQQARTHLEDAAKGFREAGDTDGELRVRHNLCHVLHRLGLAEETLAQCEHVAKMAEQSDDLGLRGLAWSSLGSAYLAMDRVPEAVSEMLRALDVQTRAGLHREAILTRQNLAAAWQLLGDLERASACLKQALEDAHTHVQPQLNPELWRALSELLRAAGDAKEAEAVCVRALTEVGAGNPMLTAALQVELAWNLLAQDRPDEALDRVHLEPVQHHAQLLAETRLVRASALFALNRGDPAIALLDELQDSLSGEALRLGVRALLLAGRHALDSGDLAEATTLCDQAITTAEAAHKSDLHISALALQADILARAHDFEAAHRTLVALRKLEHRVDSRRQRQHVRAMNAVYQVTLAQREAAQERQQNARLQAANEALTRLAQARNDTLGIVAHDLRSPLAGILLCSEVIASVLHSEKPDTTEAEAMAINIHTAAVRMNQDIEALLTTQVVVNRHIAPTPGGASIDHAVTDAMSGIHRWAHKKNIQIRMEGQRELRANADQRALREIFDNLLSNAVKFSEPGTTVIVHTHRDTAGVHIAVRDQGPGLSVDDQAKLYQRFGRLTPNPTRGERSTGIGLFGVKSLIDAMGAEIRCRSVLGQGTEFTVILAP